MGFSIAEGYKKKKETVGYTVSFENAKKFT